MFDVVIIGCGVVGAAAAYELSKYGISAAVLEKENDVASGTSKANSGIIHAGYDPEPGTLMAKLNVRGAYLAGELCRKLDVPYKQIGSLVLAFDERDMASVRQLYERGRTNGVKDLELLDAEQVRLIEPNACKSVCGALFAADAAIICPWEYTLALAETAVKNGVKLYLNSPVRSISPLPSGGYRLFSDGAYWDTRFILNAAGVHADDIHNMAAEPEFSITPVRGEYFLMDKCESKRAAHILFGVPGEFGKGVLVAPTVHGNLIVGPGTEPVDDKENTGTTYGGLDYVKQTALKAVPSIDFHRCIRNFSGLRAVSDTDDFIVRENAGAKGFIDIAGIKSPGLSAAPAIAEMAVELLQSSGLKLERKERIVDSRKRIRFKGLSPDEKNELIMRNPAYGNVICRCETVTEGEILDALSGPIPPQSIDGVKRRTGSGLGRCQGGFCGPKILSIIAREKKQEPVEILQDKAGTFVLTDETKTGGSHA
ncbi:MAG: L-2-hydroxyglutarate oxidase LhgO [Firmicutes bacterium ADurb.Bin182]|nr:MAG: L-2-hydroxyglutarate oxidase LhgO [Firmicutes bacterium ADurb.Bin182]